VDSAAQMPYFSWKPIAAILRFTSLAQLNRVVLCIQLINGYLRTEGKVEPQSAYTMYGAPMEDVLVKGSATMQMFAAGRQSGSRTGVKNGQHHRHVPFLGSAVRPVLVMHSNYDQPFCRASIQWYTQRTTVCSRFETCYFTGPWNASNTANGEVLGTGTGRNGGTYTVLACHTYFWATQFCLALAMVHRIRRSGMASGFLLLQDDVMITRRVDWLISSLLHHEDHLWIPGYPRGLTSVANLAHTNVSLQGCSATKHFACDTTPVKNLLSAKNPLTAKQHQQVYRTLNSLDAGTQTLVHSNCAENKTLRIPEAKADVIWVPDSLSSRFAQASLALGPIGRAFGYVLCHFHPSEVNKQFDPAARLAFLRKHTLPEEFWTAVESHHHTFLFMHPLHLTQGNNSQRAEELYSVLMA